MVKRQKLNELSFTFDELVNETNANDHFESVLTSDQFWENAPIPHTDTSDNRASHSTTFDIDEPELNKVDCLNYFDTQPEHVDILENMGDKYIKLSIKRDVSLIKYEDLYKYDITLCILYKQLSSEVINFSCFLKSFKLCLNAGRIEQAKYCALIFLENKKKLPRKLSLEQKAHLIELIFRVVLDFDFSELLLAEMVSLFSVGLTDANESKDALSWVVLEKMKDIFSGFPFRSIAVGNFLALVSSTLSCLFYDLLLGSESLDDFSSLLSKELLLVNYEDVDKVQFNERLLLLYSRLTHSTNYDSSKMLHEIRALKSRLPRGMIPSSLGVQEALTKMSGFLVANQCKRLN